MFAPAIWFVFLDNLGPNIEHYGGWDSAILALRDETTKGDRQTLISFFREASMAEGDDCAELVLEGTEQTLRLGLEGKTCQEFYRDMLSYFEERPAMPDD